MSEWLGKSPKDSRMGVYRKISAVFIGLCFMIPCLGDAEEIDTVGLTPSQKVYSLSLVEVSKLALDNNLDIQIAKFEASIAQTDEEKVGVVYDMMFEGEVGYQKDKNEKTSTILGTKSLTNDYNIGLIQNFPTGTNVSVDLTNRRNFSNSSFTTSPLTHESSLVFTFEQALGKNFLGIQDRGKIKVTQLEVGNRQYTSLDKIEQILARVQRAYWDMVLYKERKQIEENMVAMAKRLYDLNQEKLREGLTELPDAIAAEVNYRNQKNHLKAVRNLSRSKMNVLKLLLDQTDENVVVVPTDSLNTVGGQENYPDSLKKAFGQRRDFKSIQNEVHASDIQLSMEKNNLWPQINLKASLARNSLGDHFPDSVEGITGEDHPDFFSGITVQVPIQNTQARAQLKAQQWQKAKVLVGMKLLEKKIVIEVTDQVRDCNILKEIADEDELIAALQAQKLVEEEKRFNRGRSNTDTVIRFQEDLIQARWAAAQSKYNYLVSLVDLRVMEASLLNEYWPGKF